MRPSPKASSSRTRSPRSTARPRRSPIPSQIDGLVAISDLAANQVVVTNQFVTQQDSLSTFSQLLKNNEVADHHLGRPDPRRGRPPRARRLREPPRHRRRGDAEGAATRPKASGPTSTASRPGTCTRRCRSSPSARPASSNPARPRPTNPDGTPAGTDDLRPDHLRGAGRRGPADRLGRRRRPLPHARREGLPARRPSRRSTSNAPLPGETQAELTPYGPEGRPQS